MKEELKNLGFVKASKNHNYELRIQSDMRPFIIKVNFMNIVWLERYSEAIQMFPYNYERMKSLIKLLQND